MKSKFTDNFVGKPDEKKLNVKEFSESDEMNSCAHCVNAMGKESLESFCESL